MNKDNLEDLLREYWQHQNRSIKASLMTDDDDNDDYTALYPKMQYS